MIFLGLAIGAGLTVRMYHVKMERQNIEIERLKVELSQRNC
jgi:hypothetical protein